MKSNLACKLMNDKTKSDDCIAGVRSPLPDKYTVNPLLSPLGGLFFPSTFEGWLNREGGA